MGFMPFIMACCCIPACLWASCCCIALGPFGILGFSRRSSAGRFLESDPVGFTTCGFSAGFSESEGFGDETTPGDPGFGDADAVLLAVGSAGTCSDADSGLLGLSGASFIFSFSST